jgi:argininosuccinate lyase
MTTELLGFGDLNYNVVHAQMGRGKSELFLSFSIAAIAQTLSKLATDICLFINQNFAFISFPEELTTGSSIMPHKKNPDVFELIRARCNQLIALPQQVSLISGNLMHGYHRDFQQLKELLFPAIQSLKDLIGMTSFALPYVQVRDGILSEDKYRYLFSVEVVNQKVLEGIPFREAYQLVGKQIAEGTFNFSGDIQHSHEGSIGNLCLDEIKRKKERVVAGFSFAASEKAIAELMK